VESSTEFELFQDREADFAARFVVKEEVQFQVKDRDPTAALDKYGEVEKLDPEMYGGADVYDASFNAEGECELLPGDKTRVVSTQPVKEQKTNE
jgi:hypothetical protein